MFKQKYIITVESETPPKICLGDSIYGATVIALEIEQYSFSYRFSQDKRSLYPYNYKNRCASGLFSVYLVQEFLNRIFTS